MQYSFFLFVSDDSHRYRDKTQWEICREDKEQLNRHSIYNKDSIQTDRDQITRHQIPPVYCQLVTQPPPSRQQEFKNRKSMLVN